MAKTVAVLKGGWSSERPVSLEGAKNVEKALKNAGYDVRPIDVQKNLSNLINDLTPKPDVAFIMLHGAGGEDGMIQSVLEMLETPYTHSGVEACALGMNKIATKAMAQSVGLKCAAHKVMSFEGVQHNIDFPKPYVIKPYNEGSSFGVQIIKEGHEPDLTNWLFGQSMMLEAYIAGRELTVAVLDGKAQTVTELVVQNGFYDFHAKYQDSKTQHIIPADIPTDVFDQAMRGAEDIYKALGCRSLARVDYRYDANKEGLVFLELNTHPGFTSVSLAPEQMEYNGMSYEALCTHLVETARLDTAHLENMKGKVA